MQNTSLLGTRPCEVRAWKPERETPELEELRPAPPGLAWPWGSGSCEKPLEVAAAGVGLSAGWLAEGSLVPQLGRAWAHLVPLPAEA